MQMHWTRLSRDDVSCASDSHGGHVVAQWLMTAGDVSSYYCDACKMAIRAHSDSNQQIVRLGLNTRKMSGKVGKHSASNDHHLRQLLARLDASGESEAADTIAWLVWWKEHYSVRFYETIHNTDRAELEPIKHMIE